MAKAVATFVYETYLQGAVNGFAVAPSAWLSFHLALVTGGYTPHQLTDASLTDIPGGDIAADGKTGTFPILTVTINGSGATPEAGLEAVLAAAPNNKWALVPAGPAVVAVVLYAITVGATTQLIAYYDNWAGLPLTPNGTDITLVSLPTPIQVNGVNLIRLVTT